MNNRIDVLCKKKWREARIIEMEKQDDEVLNIRIHYKGFNAKFDETIERKDFQERVKSIQGDKQTPVTEPTPKMK